MENRTYTFIDMFPDLLKQWKQDSCSHFSLSYSNTYTNDHRTFWSDAECVDCGKDMGNRIYWNRKE